MRLHYSTITDADKNSGDESELEVVLALLAVSGKDKVWHFYWLERSTLGDDSEDFSMFYMQQQRSLHPENSPAAITCCCIAESVGDRFWEQRLSRLQEMGPCKFAAGGCSWQHSKCHIEGTGVEYVCRP